MKPKLEELFKNALALSEDERAKLIELLSNTKGYAGLEIETAWQAEIERRELEIAEGRSDWLPGPEAMAELAARYSK